ncbi:exopolysaccharide biosynthesis polyprenyl glycosylphosphotransferase [Tsuneonella suprasediminis]|uniref:Exopolysaccharide biosynthesis polyprenyl glycosylphosphotransferase n=1 Tax=Tsuneonella suprasediminis TaxID=2306996 RepID=A0A419QY44_9SPHN|nr:exopolysaccharide biosynthesis polyprenyl glycosylphosphotransferase [Tsuneonella suprasediminis]RJX65559.1 exopolysaccharide biosynthesis polyprenyl glycosylphosphotransferase [Tsuneonella suprasediminis]
MNEIAPKTLRQGHPLDRAWVQLLILLTGVCLVPFGWFRGHVAPLIIESGINSLLLSMAATIASWYGLERLRYFAYSRRLSYVLPITSLSFGIAALAIGILRIPYSLVILLLTYLVTTFLNFTFAALTRASIPKRWLVPGGRINEIYEVIGPEDLLSIDQAEALLEEGGLEGSIIADLHFSHPVAWEKFLAEAAIQGAPVYHYRSVLELYTGQVRIDHMRENNLGSLIPNLTYLSAKRLADLVGSLILLPLLLPLFAILAAIIRIDSTGPVFFRQTRVGYRGKTFRVYKFRTMRSRDNTDPQVDKINDVITAENDPRITRVGRVLRKTRLDELPQIFNVIRGDMSWVGPRPEALDLSMLYESSVPFYRYRHIVRPGITGWAQVNQGHVTDVDDIARKLRFDFYYVRNASLWIDILIVMKTVRVMTSGFGAK